MSVSAQLKAAARAAYRNLYRASASTFAGDTEVLNAFRLKMRNDALRDRDQTDPDLYEENVNLGNEIATMLRRNVVQAQKQPSGDTWKIRFTEHTEVGSNETIKNPPSLESSRSARKRADSSHSLEHEQSLQIPKRKPTYSQLKQASKNRNIPILQESDIKESFVRGSGPGGQSINKTRNNVQLLHIPTGIRVNCQATRSLEQNRKLARRILLDKLDDIQNPGFSKQDLKNAKKQERHRQRRKKAKKAGK